MNRPPRTDATERWLPVAYALALLGGGAIVLWAGNLAPPCVFRRLSGLYCPGCGSGRVLRALASLDLAAAWRANPLVVLALPPVLYGLVRDGLMAWGVAELPWPARARRATVAVLVMVMAFWVLRNIPMWPFSLLAPR